MLLCLCLCATRACVPCYRALVSSLRKGNSLCTYPPRQVSLHHSETEWGGGGKREKGEQREGSFFDPLSPEKGVPTPFRKGVPTPLRKCVPTPLRKGIAGVRREEREGEAKERKSPQAQPCPCSFLASRLVSVSALPVSVDKGRETGRNRLSQTNRSLSLSPCWLRKGGVTASAHRCCYPKRSAFAYSCVQLSTVVYMPLLCVCSPRPARRCHHPEHSRVHAGLSAALSLQRTQHESTPGAHPNPSPTPLLS